MEQTSLLSKFQNNYRQIFATISASFILISDGMHYAWTAPIIPKLQSTNSTIKITPEDVEWLESIYLIAGICFLPLTVTFVDYLGRRRSIQTVSMMALISWLFLLFANRIEFLYIGRFIAGMASDLCFVVVPIYIAETSTENIRGVLSSAVTILMLIGVVLIYSIAPYVDFYVPNIIGLIICFLHLICVSFIPESPYYLLMKNNRVKALECLELLRDSQQEENVLTELTAMENDIEDQKINGSGKIRDLLKKHNLKCIFITIILISSQHFCGFVAILMNVHTIISNSGNVFLDASTTGIIFSVLMLLSTIVASFYIDRFGRKVFLIVSQILTAFCLLILAIYFHLNFLGYNLVSFSWIPILGVAIYAITFKSGLGLIPLIILAEIYPTNVKAIGMTFGDFMFLFFAFLSIEFYQRISRLFGIYVVFYSFAFFTLVAVLVSILIVPETKGKTLEEIQALLKKKPSGQTNRNRYT